MIDERYQAGLCVISRKAYIFGGHDVPNDGTASERMNIDKNTWKQIPNLPVAGVCLYALHVKDQILITPWQTGEFISYSLMTKSYHPKK